MSEVASQPASRWKWRLKGRRRRLALLFALLVLGGLIYLTRPSTLARIILPNLTSAIGGEVTASRVAMSGLNAIELIDLRIRAPGWDGVAGELVYADRIEVRFSLLSLLIGDLRLKSVQGDHVELRLAEAAEAPGTFSLFALKPDKGTDGGPSTPQRPSAVSIKELVLENGIRTRGQYRKLGDLRFQGELLPSSTSSSAFDFTLRGRPDAEGRLSVASITGSFDGATRAVSLAVDDLEIDGRQLAVAPIAVRSWTTRLGLEGRITEARFEYTPDQPPMALIDLEGVAMNVPIEGLEEEWSGFAQGHAIPLQATPRMTLRSGTLRLQRNEVRFEHVTGELGADEANNRVLPVPFVGACSVTLPTKSLPPFEWDTREAWFEEAARLASFTVDLAIEDFSLPEQKDGAPDTLQLPRAATKILSDFNITAWKLDLHTHAERGEPDASGNPAPLKSEGTLVLDEGSGAYEQFAYRLDEVAAVIKFANDALIVESLSGVAPGGAKASITGRLDGLSMGAEIDLRIHCDGAPIDERLFNAFEPAPREALELLFDARAARSLAEANLLPDETAIVSQRQELSRLGDDESVAATRARLQRSIDAGPFVLGGTAGFDIRVYSPPGWGKPVIVTGDVRVQNAGLLFGRFPYPLRLKEGALRVLDEAIEIVGDGLKATTPTGGELTVAGSVQIPRMPGVGDDSARGMRPLIEITDRNDALNPALLAAIPHAGDEMPARWPGLDLAPAGALLASLGLNGRVELSGLVDSDDEGRERFKFTVDFADGTAAPDAAGRAQLAESGLPWPPEFTLEHCSATLLLTPDRVVIEQCVGSNGSGKIAAKGFSELEGPNRSIELELQALPVGRAFEGYLSSDADEAAARFARYGPSGAIDGSIRRDVTATTAQTRGSLTPQFVELTLDGSRVRADRIAGRIAVDEHGLRADSLEFRLSEGNQEDGILRLSGPLGGSITGSPAGTPTLPEPAAAPPAAANPNPPTDLTQLDATLTAGRVESPLLRELLSTRAKGVIDLLRAKAAKGTYDAHYQSGEQERFSAVPRTLAVGQPDQRVEFIFAPTDSIVGDANLVRFNLHGTLVGAHEGTLVTTGSFESGGDNRLSAALTLDAKTLTPALRVQLPPPLDTACEAIGLTASQRFALDLPDVALRWPSTGSAESPDIYQLRGTVQLAGGAFHAGPTVTDLDGELTMRFRYQPRAAQQADFTGTMKASGARVFDRPLGATTIDFKTEANGKVLALNGSGDVAYGRFDLLSSIDFDKDLYKARVRVADADFEVLRRDTPATGVTPRSDGRLSAVLQVAGSTSGAVDTRTGSGRVAIRNAELASMPLAMHVLQLTQFMLPVSSRITASTAQFELAGNTAKVTQCELIAGTIQLAGTGAVDIPTFGIGLRLFPRGTVPIVSDVIGGVTNTLFAIDVSGTLREPKAAIAALPGMSEVPTPPPTDGTAPSATAAPKSNALPKPIPAETAPNAPTP